MKQLTAAAERCAQLSSMDPASHRQDGWQATLLSGSDCAGARGLSSSLMQKREYLAGELEALGFQILPSSGTYFLVADFRWGPLCGCLGGGRAGCILRLRSGQMETASAIIVRCHQNSMPGWVRTGCRSAEGIQSSAGVWLTREPPDCAQQSSKRCRVCAGLLLSGNADSSTDS